jgi:hypothetical protein
MKRHNYFFTFFNYTIVINKKNLQEVIKDEKKQNNYLSKNMPDKKQGSS